MNTAKKVIGKIFWCFHGFNKKTWAYKLVSFLGFLFRVVALPFIIPDFYEMVFHFMLAGNMPDWLYQILSRLILSVFDILGFTHLYYLMSYASTGLIYKSKTLPAWGSTLYTLFYLIYSLIPVLLIQYFYWWVILIIFVAYLILCYLLYGLSITLECSHEHDWKNALVHLIISCVVFVALMTVWGFVH